MAWQLLPTGVEPDVTAGMPELEDEHASLFSERVDRLMRGIGNRMEPNRVSIRLFGDVRRDDAEVTEVQVQV
ncbi:hypothetical protein [Streptomyces sp. BK79]|uniref:hypothetical protein n=1 Tax=Streptomyces sp. BK79 TaxID=3350097 RepID=UPI00376F6420